MYKINYRAVFILMLFLIVLSSCSLPHKNAEKYAIMELTEMGFESHPRVIFIDTPYFCFYDEREQAIYVKHHREVSSEEIDFLHITPMVDADELYKELFNWYFIAHEFGHFLGTTTTEWEGMTPYETEFFANRWAVNLLRKYEADRLGRLMGELKKIKSADETGESRDMKGLNGVYPEIAVEDPGLYLLYQIDMILNYYEDGE